MKCIHSQFSNEIAESKIGNIADKKEKFKFKMQSPPIESH